MPLPQSHRMSAELQEVLRLDPGEPKRLRLTSELLLAMRRGYLKLFEAADHPDHPTVEKLFVAADPADGWRELEDCLDEAWRNACTLNLPLSEEMKQCVVDNLVKVRYKQSTQSTATLEKTEAHVPWDELWSRVNVLLKYSESLQEELDELKLQGHDPAPGSADKSVMLARLCALAVHNVKRSFLSTYKHVPWEEMEYLLVMFIEERTVYATLAHAKANTERTADHLRCFRERLKKCKKKWTEPTPLGPEAVKERLKEMLVEEIDARAAVFARVADPKLTKLREDFTLLRDWHSLKEMYETLKVAKKALRLEDEVWVASWGWLSLGWALFVVGERVNYSWKSPNLSPRWTHVVEAIAPGGILKVMKDIRDYQAHPLGKDSSNALLGMKKKERTKVAKELKKLKKAVFVALVELESKVECCDKSDCDRVDIAKSKNSYTETLIMQELLRELKPAEQKARVEFEEIKSFFSFKTNYSYLWFISVKLAKKHLPMAVPSVLRLLLYRSMEHTESLYAELQEVTLSVISPLETLRGALAALAAAPEGPLTTFAIKGALRELAYRWHEHHQVVPTAVPFSPALFGRQLRNYLNHLDEVFRSPLELNALSNLLHKKLIPLEHGARPRLRDLRWSRAENERLLRLVELKSDMFRCAREGVLDELKRLVKEDGADVSARDCEDRTLLHAAAQGGQVHVVRWLLGLGAGAVDPLAGDWRRGCTALHVAGTAAVAEELLAANETAYSDRQQAGAWTPLYAAAAFGHAEVVAVLLRDPRALDAVDHNGLSPLHWAARHGHDQVVRLLLAAGARYQADADGLTPLVLAACSGSAPSVRLLLGAAPPPAAEDCWRAAKYAAAFAREEACFALLDELEARGLLQWGPEAREVLLQAGWGGSSAITLRLLDRWPKSVRERLDDTTGATVLHLAALNGHAELVRALLTPSSGADPLGEAAEGLTALDGAAVSGSPDTITALVEHIPGGSLQAALTRALCVAAQRGQLRAAQRLVQHGADVNAVDGEGRTPLCWAAVRGHTEVVRWLLQRGADPWWGKPLPLHLAAAYGRLSVVKLLVPPLHAGDQDDPGGEEPSALSVAVQAGSREDLQRILERFVEHLRPLSSRYTREDRLRDKAKAMAALRRKEREEGERLSLLQQSDIGGRTALHLAAAVSALPVVEYLLEREGELLRRVYSKHKNTGVPRQDGLTVYARDAKGRTALQYGAARLCTPSVVEALLQRMADEMWMALGHKDLREVLSMAVDVLELAEPQLGSRRLCGAIRHWLGLSSSGPCVNEHEHARNWWTR